MSGKHYVVRHFSRRLGSIGVFGNCRDQLIADDWEGAIAKVRTMYETNHIISVVNSAKAHVGGNCCGFDYLCRAAGAGNVGYWPEVRKHGECAVP
jgi:hypothetical protein